MKLDRCSSFAIALRSPPESRTPFPRRRMRGKLKFVKSDDLGGGHALIKLNAAGSVNAATACWSAV